MNTCQTSEKTLLPLPLGDAAVLKQPKHKKPPLAATDFPEAVQKRFWASVTIRQPNECWEWTRTKDSNGYGQFTHTREYIAHRVAYQLSGKIIPDGLTIDHLCRNKACMNPAHMEPVTRGENTRRANASITHCPHGHAYTPENTYMAKGNKRACRACGRIRWANKQQKHEQTTT